MKRTLLAVAALAAAVPADAFWLGEFYCYLEQRRAEQNAWPAQYVEQDRRNAAAPFDIMIENGWRRQNLLGSHHFNEDCTQLTQAGRLRVQWILTQAPPEHRQPFIERSLDEQTTQNRIATVNDFAMQVVRDGSSITAQETHLTSDGRPAVTVDFVNTQFRENMPTPTLPAATPAGASE
ncbi:hypothetical protein Pla108_30590 [Botrimarina colliarenosi]|uniref:Uncharacterized protein n=1 Tax=Botrimarina colliarenosi TaxID=2528001 RepID=A0A5C6AAB8_9BACT|nr:hypothetical protein [Botrimarina colliarenosi]TWT95981.1 hypothetical protein Pla108_30590 [Botrimarina colliarenosi]